MLSFLFRVILRYWIIWIINSDHWNRDTVTIHDYDLAATKINELDIDVVNLKEKVKNLEISYSKIAIVGSLPQDDFISNDEYHNIHQRIVNHLNQEQVDFCLYLNRTTQ